MAVIYLRHVLQRPLTFGELDANFDNLNNAILNLGLDDLTDVVITNGNNGDLLVFDGTNWVNTNAIVANTSTDALRITQTGTGNALLVEDETNPDATPFAVNAI